MTLGGCSGPYRSAIRRVITGTLDMCVRKGMIARHTLSGIELAPRVVSAEQYEEEAEAKALVFVNGSNHQRYRQEDLRGLNHLRSRSRQGRGRNRHCHGLLPLNG